MIRPHQVLFDSRYTHVNTQYCTDDRRSFVPRSTSLSNLFFKTRQGLGRRNDDCCAPFYAHPIPANDLTVGRGQPRSWILHLHGRVNKVTNDFFHSLGYWVATNSASTLALSFVFVLACSFGFANFKVDFSGELQTTMGNVVKCQGRWVL